MADPTRQGARSGRSLKNALVFGGGVAFARGFAFVLLPLYTRAIPPAQYGALSILLAISTGASFLFSLGLDTPFYRTFFRLATDRPQQQLFIDSVWRFTVIVPILFAVVIGGIAWPFLDGLPRISGFDGMLALLSAGFWVASSLVPLQLTRMQERLMAFLGLTIVNGLATAGCTLVGVVAIHGEVTGWLLAAVTANAISLAAALVLIPWHRRGGFDGAQVRAALRFGLPLLPYTVTFWALLLADRLILSGLVSSRQLGIYSLGSNLALPVMIAVQSLNQGFMPDYVRAGANPRLRAGLKETVVLQIALTLLLTLGGVLLAPPLVDLLAAPSYRSAAPVVVWTVVGYGLLGLYYLPLNGTTLGAGKKNGVWVTTSIAAAVNLGALFVVVPGGGIVAAAIASAGGYLALLIAMAIYAARPGGTHGNSNPVRYSPSRIAPAFLVAATVYIVASGVLPEYGALAIASRCAAAAGYIGILIALGIVKPPTQVALMLRRRAARSAG